MQGTAKIISPLFNSLRRLYLHQSGTRVNSTIPSILMFKSSLIGIKIAGVEFAYHECPVFRDGADVKFSWNIRSLCALEHTSQIWNLKFRNCETPYLYRDADGCLTSHAAHLIRWSIRTGTSTLIADCPGKRKNCN